MFCKFFKCQKKNTVKSPLSIFFKVFFRDKKNSGENSPEQMVSKEPDPYLMSFDTALKEGCKLFFSSMKRMDSVLRSQAPA